jgi:hypothetical protein
MAVPVFSEKNTRQFMTLPGKRLSQKILAQALWTPWATTTLSLPRFTLMPLHWCASSVVRLTFARLPLPVFRWGGEVWPGTPMDWEIHEENERQAVADPEAAQRTWTTRLALTLPTLKTVEVRMTLAGTTLQVHLAARENATLALLSDGGNELTERFGAAGLQLSRLQIGALALEPAAQDIRKADDAA